jgi:hypothetical protein
MVFAPLVARTSVIAAETRIEILSGIPKVVLANRMACLKGGVVANVVVSTADYVRFATRYRFRPHFCHAADPGPRERTRSAMPRTT